MKTFLIFIVVLLVPVIAEAQYHSKIGNPLGIPWCSDVKNIKEYCVKNNLIIDSIVDGTDIMRPPRVCIRGCSIFGYPAYDVNLMRNNKICDADFSWFKATLLENQDSKKCLRIYKGFIESITKKIGKPSKKEWDMTPEWMKKYKRNFVNLQTVWIEIDGDYFTSMHLDCNRTMDNSKESYITIEFERHKINELTEFKKLFEIK